MKKFKYYNQAGSKDKVYVDPLDDFVMLVLGDGGERVHICTDDIPQLAQALLQFNRAEINRCFDEAVTEVHAANRGLSEEQVMDEVNHLVHEIRSEWYATSRR